VAEVARGHISDRPFVRTVHTIAAKRFSGDLVMNQAGTVYRIAWHRGLAVGGDIPDSAGPLPQRLLKVFALDTAEFVLDDESTVQSEAGASPVDARWLIFHGLVSHYDDFRLRRELAALTQHEFQLSAVGDDALSSYGFSAADRHAIELVRERAWTLSELVAVDPTMDRRRVMAVVYALLATDALTVAQAPRATSGASRHPRPAAGPAVRKPAAAAKPRAAAGSRSPAGGAGAAPAAAAAARPSAGAGPGDNGDGMQALRGLVQEKSRLLSSGADHFQLLGVQRTTPVAEIRSLYFNLAKQLHPDRVRALKLDDLTSVAQQVFAALNQSFTVLSDEKKRSAYVAELDSSGRADRDDPAAEAKVMAIFRAEEAFKQGEMAMRRNHWRQAAEQFGRAVELNPDEGEYQALAAWAQWNCTDDKATIADQVLAQFRQAMALAPNSARVFLYRGRLARQLGDPNGAQTSLQRALELDTTMEAAHRELKIVQARLSGSHPGAAKTKGKGKGLLGRLLGR
jgi:tetratricopeptide (TPR) repeat protein